MKRGLITIAAISAVMSFPWVSMPATAATFTPVDLSTIANLRLQSKNERYPEGDFLSRFAVPFSIAETEDNAWGSGNGIGGGGGNDGLWAATLDIGQSNVKTIYTLANTDWGRDGEQRFSITANYSDGFSVVWTYTDGQQLRDWNLFPAFSTTISGTDTNEVFRVSPPLPVFNSNPDVLDMQTLAVPAAFHSAVLETLVFTDLRQTFVHSVFVSGITLSDIGPVTAALQPTVIPLPAALPLFGSALVGLGWVGRRRKESGETT